MTIRMPSLSEGSQLNAVEGDSNEAAQGDDHKLKAVLRRFVARRKGVQSSGLGQA